MNSSQPASGRQIIVRADEVDQDGTAIQSPGKQLPLSALDQRDGASPATNRMSQARSTRPILRRDGSAPPPPSQPPPAAPPQQQDLDTPTDSLSLPQLRQLVSQFPKAEQRAYAFQYADAESFAQEIEEWFQYSEQDGNMILSARETFEQKWRAFLEAHRGLDEEDLTWLDVSEGLRKKILSSVLSSLNHSDQITRTEALEVIFYILGGVWATTAGLERHDEAEKQSSEEDADEEVNPIQIEWMHVGADLLVECSGLQSLYDCTKTAFGDDKDARYAPVHHSSRDQLTCYSLISSDAVRDEDGHASENPEDFRTREQVLLLSCWYILVESARSRPDSRMSEATRNAIRELECL
jgi:N1221-like protein